MGNGKKCSNELVNYKKIKIPSTTLKTQTLILELPSLISTSTLIFPLNPRLFPVHRQYSDQTALWLSVLYRHEARILSEGRPFMGNTLIDKNCRNGEIEVAISIFEERDQRMNFPGQVCWLSIFYLMIFHLHIRNQAFTYFIWKEVTTSHIRSRGLKNYHGIKPKGH